MSIFFFFSPLNYFLLIFCLFIVFLFFFLFFYFFFFFKKHFLIFLLLLRGVIVDQFGPFGEFVENFRHYGCGNGFLGLINCVEADEHLASPNTFLLRFSRREPEKLTFSYKFTNGARKVVCRHKRKPRGVPIRRFISQNFNASFQPVAKSLALVEYGVDSLDNYVDQSGYLL